MAHHQPVAWDDAPKDYSDLPTQVHPRSLACFPTARIREPAIVAAWCMSDDARWRTRACTQVLEEHAKREARSSRLSAQAARERDELKALEEAEAAWRGWRDQALAALC